MPGTADERGFGAEDFDPQVGEFEFSHFMAGTGVPGFVAVDRGLPAMLLFVAGEKSEIRRIPVSGQEGVEVVTVPGVLLGDKDLFDSGFRVGGRGPALRRQLKGAKSGE